jgi:hypothetical protein
MESPGRIVYRIVGTAFTARLDIVYRGEDLDLLMDIYTGGHRRFAVRRVGSAVRLIICYLSIIYYMFIIFFRIMIQRF